jgi:hypothetical protein
MSIHQKLDEILEVLLWIQYKVVKDRPSVDQLDFLWICSLSGICEKEESVSVLEKLTEDGIIAPADNATKVPKITSYGIHFITTGGYSGRAGLSNSSAA